MTYCNTSVAEIIHTIDRIKNQQQELEVIVSNTLIFQSDKIIDLESLIDPFSSNGEAICNVGMEDYEI